MTVRRSRPAVRPRPGQPFPRFRRPGRTATGAGPFPPRVAQWQSAGLICRKPVVRSHPRGLPSPARVDPRRIMRTTRAPTVVRLHPRAPPCGGAEHRRTPVAVPHPPQAVAVHRCPPPCSPTERSSTWQSAWFGSRRPRVQIPPFRPFSTDMLPADSHGGVDVMATYQTVSLKMSVRFRYVSPCPHR